jgi:hypothetical protein
LTVPSGNKLTLTAAAVPNGPVAVEGTLVIKGGAAAPAAGITVADGGVIEVTRGDPSSALIPGTAGTLTVADSQTLEIRSGGTVKLVDEGGLVLTFHANTPAKLTGGGKLIVGATEIIGGAEGWQASTASVNIAITAGITTDPNPKPNETTIAGSATSGVLTAGAGATITQREFAGNKLIIAANTTIALGGAAGAGGSPAAEVKGSLILIGDKDNPGEISLVDAGTPTSFVMTVGTATSNTAFGTATRIGGKEFQVTHPNDTVKRAHIYTTDSGGGPGLFLQMDNKTTGTAGAGLKGGNNAENTITINALAQVD